jgi:hypothetical protein
LSNGICRIFWHGQRPTRLTKRQDAHKSRLPPPSLSHNPSSTHGQSIHATPIPASVSISVSLPARRLAHLVGHQDRTCLRLIADTGCAFATTAEPDQCCSLAPA